MGREECGKRERDTSKVQLLFQTDHFQLLDKLKDLRNAKKDLLSNGIHDTAYQAVRVL